MHCWHAFFQVDQRDLQVGGCSCGLCLHAVQLGDGFNWKWSNGEFWKLVVVRNLLASCGSLSCSISTADVGQQFVDREGGVFFVKKKWKFVTTRPIARGC